MLQMETTGRELRQAARSLARSPGFTVTAAATLAIGIGAATAIFTVLDAVVLKPLPYPDADRLVSVGHRVPVEDADARWGVSPSGFFHFREQSGTLEAIGVYRGWPVTVTGAGEAERAHRASVSADVFGVLGARPEVGRLLMPSDDLPGAAPVAVLSHAFWVRRHGADRGVVGRTIAVDGESVEVVGVLEPGVALPDPGVRADVWMAEQLDPAAEPQNWHAFTAVGRLRPGATPGNAQAELNRFVERFTELYPSAYTPAFMEETGFTAHVEPLRDVVVGDVGRVLWLLVGAVVLVLLIAGADAANLFLVRTEARRHDTAMRAALGATRGSLLRGHLVEGLMVALAGGAAGLLLAYAGVRALVAAAPAGLPRIGEVAVSAESAGFAILLALALGVLLGVLPRARGGWRPADAFQEVGRGATPSRGATLVRNSLVVMQVAVSLVLLAGAGLLLRTYAQLRAVDPGFDANGALTVDLTLPWTTYESHADVSVFYAELSARLAALRGVRSVGLGEALPLARALPCRGVFVEDRPPQPGEDAPCVATVIVAPGYFAALGISMSGRAPEWGEVQARTAGAVVTRAMAERLWPGEDPIGKGIRGMRWDQPFYPVVGVTGDLRADGLDRSATEAVFFPPLPREGAPLWSPARSMSLVVRTDGARPAAVASLVRSTVADIDPHVPVANVRTLEEVVAGSIARTSFIMVLMHVTAAVALVLGAVGLYGVLAQAVAQRHAEIAVRVAMGARGGNVAALVVRHSLALALTGVVLGIGGALALTRVLRSLLFGVSPTDALVLTGAAAVLVFVAMIATAVPVRRALRIEPMAALRGD